MSIKKIADDIKYLFVNLGDTLSYDKTFRAKVVDTKSNNKLIVSYKIKKT